MKYAIGISVLSLSFFLSAPSPSNAADMTISTTGPQATRLAAAIGARMNLTDAQGKPRSATAAEIKTTIINELRSWVISYEEDIARKALVPAPFDPT